MSGQHSERYLVDALARRHGQVSMRAHRWVFADHVPDLTGFAGSVRIADFIAVDCWLAQRPRLPLRNEVHGFEIKTSRSDWLTELRDPEKAAAWMPYTHRWWLVAADRSIVRDDLPDGWGLLVPHGNGLTAWRQAPLREALPMTPPMQVAFARAVAKTARRITQDQLQERAS
jgi:hypothetical protein